MSKENNAQKAIDSLREYISGISKRDRRKIERELEQEPEEEEPNLSKGQNYTITYSHQPYIQSGWNVINNSNWTVSIPQGDYVGLHLDANEVEQDVQDVDFGE